MPDCRVTFVIPCFNHGRFVGAAVQSCLRQRDADIRVVIVDDGSTDGSTPDACDALASDRVHVMHQVNRGLPAARNAGIARARELARSGDRAWHAEYLAFLDADDFLEETFAKDLAQALDAAPPEVSHAYCQERLVELGHGTWKVPEWDADLLLITNLHPVTCLVRWSAIDAISPDAGSPTQGFPHAGPFDESMRLGYEDWDLWITLSSRGYRGLRVPKMLFNWRRHSNDTMIFDAVRRHDELYAHIIRRHPDLYGPKLEALLRRTNSMIRAWNMNWLDESCEPIPLINLKRSRDELVRMREHHHALGAELAAARTKADRAEKDALTLAAERDVARDESARLRALNARIAADYERMVAVRLHHAAHRVLAKLPKFISSPLIAVGGGLARTIAKLAGVATSRERGTASRASVSPSERVSGHAPGTGREIGPVPGAQIEPSPRERTTEGRTS